MKRVRMIVGSLVLVSLLAVGSMAARAQGGYTVQPGDNLWRLSGDYLGDPVKWGEVLGANPYLKQPGRQFQLPDGRIVVLIKPGEVLEGLNDLGVTAEPVPISELKPAPVPPVAEKKVEVDVLKSNLPFLYWISGLLLLTFVLAYLVTRRFFSSAATAGAPIIPGGIRLDEPEAVEERFQRIAERRLADTNPTANLTTDRPVRVGPIEGGVLNGFGRVQYRHGLPQLRRLNNEPAYRARFRFPDGHEEELQFLQACANDVTYSGARYLGFTFTPGRAVLPTPAPAPTDIPTGPRAIPVKDPFL